MMNSLKKYILGICISAGLTLVAPFCTAEITVQGDFNGDGFDDLAIGVQGEDQGTSTFPSTYSINDSSEVEGSLLVFTVTRSDGIGSQSVDFTTREQLSLPSDIRALGADDYTDTSGTLTFQSGEISKTISVITQDDGTNERDNTLEMVLSNATNGAFILDGLALGTIINNDPAPNYSVSAFNVNEGASLQFTIVSDRASEITYTIDYATSNSGAVTPADYTAQSATLTYGWNDRSKTISVATLDDALPEANEGVTMTLSNASGGAGIATASFTANIIDNDSTSLIIPDSNFKNYLLRFDTSADGEIDATEAAQVNVIYCGNRGIANLSGIEHFVNLTTLYCANNQLTSLPNMSALTRLQVLGMGGNNLTALPNLAASITTIYCDNNSINSLTNLSSGQHPNLSTLSCNNNNLSQLPNPALSLQDLNIEGNLFGSDDCNDIDSFENQGLTTFTYNPQSDGSTLSCTTQIPPESPPAIVLEPLPAADLDSDAVATIAGQFRVDESAAATFSAPIFTPTGIAGVGPQLSLNYSSQNGNASLGLGWNVGGLSAISRCRQTMESNDQDIGVNLSATDRFCLDGQQMIAINNSDYGADGTEYRLEIDNQTKIISYGSSGTGPSYFRLWRKDGSVSEYGNTPDSKLLSNRLGQVQTSVLSWALSRFEDSVSYNTGVDNAILFSYHTDPSISEQVIAQINYGPNNQIVFNYRTDRQDVVLRYNLGGHAQLRHLLTSVVSSDNNAQVRRLDLNYDNPLANPPRLIDITESASAVSAPKTVFSWSARPLAGYIQGSSGTLANDFIGGQPADTDGDGDQDFIYIKEGSSSTIRYLNVYRSDYNQFSQSVTLVNNASCSDILFDADKDNEDEAWHPLDYNGDGRTDVLVARQGWWYVHQAKTDGCFDTVAINIGVATSGVAEKALLLDINGDGLGDLIRPFGNSIKVYYLRPTYNASAPYAFDSQNPGTMPLPIVSSEYDEDSETFISRNVDFENLSAGDFNGDGKVDLIVRISELEEEFDFGIPTYSSTSYYRGIYSLDAQDEFVEIGRIDFSSFKSEDMRLVDLNADGLTDILYRTSGNSGQWYFKLSTGDGFTGAQAVNINYNYNGNRTLDDRHISLADYNLDGYPDIHFVVSEDLLYVALGTGQGFTSGTDTGVESDIVEEGYLDVFLDLNGDGLTDHLFLKSGDDRYRASLHRGAFVAANRIIAIDNGLGNHTQIDYHALTDPAQPNLYQKGSTAASFDYGRGSPVFNLLAPMYVVSSVHSSAPTWDNAAAMAGVDYRYQGARMQAGGRGFLGFTSLTTIDLQTGIETSSGYRQEFPFIGSPETTETRTANGQLLAHASNQWQTQLTYEGNSQFTFIEESIESTYALNGGAKMQTIKTTNSYDAYANPTNIDIVTHEGASETLLGAKLTSHIYDNDSSKWHLGRLTSTQVTHQKTGVTDIIRSSSFEYDATTGLLNKEVIEPNGDDQKNLTTVYQHDTFGNILQITQCSSHVASCGTETTQDANNPYFINRSSYTEYDSDGRYPVKTRNSFNQVISEVLSRNNLGQSTSSLDINGVATDRVYGTFGQSYFSRNSTGAWSKTSRRLCSSGINCPVSTAIFRQHQQVADGSYSYDYIDALGRTVFSQKPNIDGILINHRMDYDIQGRTYRFYEPWLATTAANYNTISTYDLLSRPLQITHPDSSRSSSSYTDFTSSLTNAQNQIRTEVKNALGERLSVTDALGSVISYRYNAAGNIIELRLNNQIQSTMDYDNLGRKITMVDQDKGGSAARNWLYQYNALGELVQQIDAKGQTMESYRDELGRTTRKVDYNASGNIENDFRWDYNNIQGRGNGIGQLSQEQNISDGFSRYLNYDQFNRLTQSVTSIESNLYYESSTYDGIGRLFQQFDASGNNAGLRFVYNSLGYMIETRDASGNTSTAQSYQKIMAMDARGNITHTIAGNGLDTYQYFDAATGRIQDVNTGISAQELHYQWDNLGNLIYREDYSGTKTLKENFSYDLLNRVTNATVEGRTGLNISYDASGNIVNKSDRGNYTYGGSCNGITAGPHAVTAAGSKSYCYDANGNQTSGDGRSISYTSFDKANEIEKNGHTTRFNYSPNRSRYLRQDETASGNTKTYYVGNVEIIQRPGADIEYRRNLGNAIVANYANGVQQIHFIYKDHLGSTDVITNSSGDIVQSFSFDAFGQQRNALDWDSIASLPISPISDSLTLHGYTGHEMLDEVGLIHMNGRIYDPSLGRFLQADPNIQAADNTQSLNRYSYVLNNPLNATDPSGFFFKGLLKTLKSFASVIVVAVLTVYCGPCSAAFIGAAAGAVGAAVNGGNILKGAVFGAISGQAFYFVGGLDYGGLQGLIKPLAHGVVGGLMGVLQGGKFGHGFLSAGITQALAGRIGRLKLGGQRIIAAAVVGGTVSELTGGKFANGAITGAFSRALNDEAHPRDKDLPATNVIDNIAEELAGENFKTVVTVTIEGAAKIEGKFKSVSFDIEYNSTGTITGTAGLSVKRGLVLIGAKVSCAPECNLSVAAGIGIETELFALSNKLGFNTNATITLSYEARYGNFGGTFASKLSLKAIYSNIKTFFGALYRGTSYP